VPSAKLVWITPDSEKVIGYCARVSNPANQDNPEVAKLLSYCIKNKHWSVFEQACMCIEIETSRAISTQILRHRSFNFQEFSQRYSAVTQFELYEARRQDSKNRQNSVDDMSDEDKQWFIDKQAEVQNLAHEAYTEALSKGVAKEQARFLLPMATSTKLYMTGNIRNWIHYIELRTENGTQLEHRVIAEAIKDIFKTHLPIISEALKW
jgi:thymidylate synthase (FAD)